VSQNQSHFATDGVSQTVHLGAEPLRDS